ncbi:hypothetical protein BDF21DRAFT_401326 [Thamnidium elegans]|nr:hypothetical protein BDF21DRAFT_401326 [Thamnidium elegans]
MNQNIDIQRSSLDKEYHIGIVYENCKTPATRVCTNTKQLFQWNNLGNGSVSPYKEICIIFKNMFPIRYKINRERISISKNKVCSIWSTILSFSYANVKYVDLVRYHDNRVNESSSIERYFHCAVIIHFYKSLLFVVSLIGLFVMRSFVYWSREDIGYKVESLWVS